MHPTLKIFIAIIAGAVIGGFVNMGIIVLGHEYAPLPKQLAEMTNDDWTFTLLTFPFLAHAIGTFVGGLIAGAIYREKAVMLGIFIGCFFLIGGTMMVFQVESPNSFILVDLIFAYIPMGYLAGKILQKK
jgi:hypothetical protein